jgi:hypothetical protein
MTAQEAITLIRNERRRQRTMWSANHDKNHYSGEWIDLFNHYIHRLEKGIDTAKTLSQIGALALAAMEAYPWEDA